MAAVTRVLATAAMVAVIIPWAGIIPGSAMVTLLAVTRMAATHTMAAAIRSVVTLMEAIMAAGIARRSSAVGMWGMASASVLGGVVVLLAACAITTIKKLLRLSEVINAGNSDVIESNPQIL